MFCKVWLAICVVYLINLVAKVHKSTVRMVICLHMICLCKFNIKALYTQCNMIIAHRRLQQLYCMVAIFVFNSTNHKVSNLQFLLYIYFHTFNGCIFITDFKIGTNSQLDIVSCWLLAEPRWVVELTAIKCWHPHTPHHPRGDHQHLEYTEHDLFHCHKNSRCQRKKGARKGKAH